MIPIRTERLLIRNWEQRDRDLFHRINSDDRVMEFFPVRRSRSEADELFDVLRDGIAGRGWGFAALELAEGGDCVGFCGIHPTALEPILPAGTVEIGWRLAPEHWRRGYATEAAKAWLRFGFDGLGLREIVSFAVWNNLPSLAVMERIGMRRDAVAEFDHPRVPDSHPHLRRHRLYRLTAAEWRRTKKAAR